MVDPKLIQKAKARIQSRSPNAFGIEPSNDEILKEVSSIEQENKEQNSAEEQDRNAQLESRMESSQKSRALFGDQISPELKEYAYNIFPSLNELTSKYNTEIPFSPRSNIEIPFAPKEMPSTEIKSRQPASIAERPQEEISRIENQKPIQQEPKKATTPIAPIQTEQQQSDIDKLIKQSEEEQDRAGLWKQSAKLRDAIMGAGLGRIKQTDVSMYEDLEKKAKRPIQSLLLKQELEDKQARRDPNSNISKLMRKSIEDLGTSMQGFENISADQLEKLYPNLVSGIMAKINAETRRDIASMSREDRATLRREKEDLKKAAAAKLSDKQLTPLVDVDSIIGNLDNVMSMANEKFVGPLDARIPDVMTSGENAAFRSSVGRMVDSYRKAITGAGASAMELQKLEGRLPQPTDTLEQFKAKALSFRKELVRNRNTYLRTLKKQGKDVSEWETSVESEQSITPEERLKILEDQLSKNSNRLEELKKKKEI